MAILKYIRPQYIHHDDSLLKNFWTHDLLPPNAGWPALPRFKARHKMRLQSWYKLVLSIKPQRRMPPMMVVVMVVVGGGGGGEFHPTVKFLVSIDGHYCWFCRECGTKLGLLMLSLTLLAVCKAILLKQVMNNFPKLLPLSLLITCETCKGVQCWTYWQRCSLFFIDNCKAFGEDNFLSRLPWSSLELAWLHRDYSTAQVFSLGPLKSGVTWWRTLQDNIQFICEWQWMVDWRQAKTYVNYFLLPTNKMPWFYHC